MTPTTYRRAAVECASPIGLVILLYDTLVGDIQRAIEAVKAGDIEKRCHALNHVFQVLQQLEAGLNMQDGGETARNLARFYSHLRAKMLEAQFKQSVEVLSCQIALILEVRAAWQSTDAAVQSVREVGHELEMPIKPAQSLGSGDAAHGEWTV